MGDSTVSPDSDITDFKFARKWVTLLIALNYNQKVTYLVFQ